ncbi:MAG: type II toxin-antitoxin system HipA family toxin [Hyphomicrobium sp.]|jgi:serine/threonine-protein kinase HipA
MARTLDVYFANTIAARLHQDDAAALSLTYDQTYLASPPARAVSVSMPLRSEPWPDQQVRPFFSGLLPDEGARQRLAAALGISAANAFGLLEIIGGECAGALSLFPAGTAPPATDDDIELLGPDHLATVLEKLRTRPLLGGEAGVRLSLAGAQDKLAVCLKDETLALPKGGRPTTHILKPAIPTLKGAAHNEYFCMCLAAALNLPVPSVQIGHAGDTPYLLIARYDREILPDGRIQRLHQEDFCQALSIPPELKYEDEGGPGTQAALALIGRATAQPATDQLSFLRRVIFNYLVGNADAHAKNFALLYKRRIPDLAPLYDVLCTAAYPRLAKKLAMSIGNRSVPDTIQLSNWYALVPDTRGSKRLLAKNISLMAAEAPSAADALIEQMKDQGLDHPILATIRDIITTRSQHLSRITSAL